MNSPGDELQQYFLDFIDGHDSQNYGIAFKAFESALHAYPGDAFRYFLVRASGALSNVLEQTGKAASTANLLDKLIGQHPDIHLLCDDQNDIERIRALRESNMQKGLPSVAIITQGKSASIPVQNIFSAGFELPGFAYSLTLLEVIESWACNFAHGGACNTTHLWPLRHNVLRLKRAGVQKVIVHVRDPRQRLLSMIHHVLRYSDAMVHTKNDRFADKEISDQIESLISFYLFSIYWLQGWLRAADEIGILFSTYEDFLTDRDAFIQRYLDYYGAASKYFVREKALTIPQKTDDHFRTGKADEWRRRFPPDDARRLTELLPDFLKQRFNWED